MAAHDVDDGLDAGPRELHPGDRGMRVERGVERVAARRRGPHEHLGVGEVDDIRSCRLDGVAEPSARALRLDRDPRHGERSERAVGPP